ncbi:MAG: ATP-binding cassette domain-containing protein, partial [Sulfurimicrobium sp.]|nr:ATP-binding cassette domain-containing protein [Sulfurimicrobium sp.]
MAQYVFTMNRVGKIVPPKRQILKDISLSFFPGAKIGLLGLNGSGKSTVLRIMAGVDKDIEGEAIPMPNISIGYLPQEPQLDPEKTVREEVEAGLGEVMQAQQKLEEIYAAYAEPDADFDKLAEEQARYEAIISVSGADAATQLEIAADALRLPLWDAVIKNLSGGEKRRVALCKLLLSKPDMLLLDEPTNHLDLDAVLWLESWLKSFPGTLVMISHDRDFLDAVVGQILHIDAGQMKLYTGNYSTFERTRAERLALQQAMYVKQQREVAHLHTYIERFRAKASKARQAQSRLKALARMELISAAHVDTPFSFRFREAEGVSDPLLTLEDAKVGYGETALLDKIRLTLRPGSRIGLLGRNGAGKSTLV